MSTPSFLTNSDSSFDRLPDDVLMQIFDELRDAKSLSLCSAVCTRFRSLIPQTRSVLLSIPAGSAPVCTRNQNRSIVAFANKVLIKPFRSLLRAIKSKASFNSSSNCTCRDEVGDEFYRSPAQILRNFGEIRRLEVRFPGNVACVDEFCGGSAALKWKAEFGSELQSCVIVGGTSISPIRMSDCSRIETDTREEFPNFDNDELKMRIVWTISCLIAASVRHTLLRETVNEHRSLQDLTATDEIGQGMISMNAEQIEEMRINSKKAKEEKDESSNDRRTIVPELKMKMWIVPELELPEEGCVIKGATLVVIRPVERWSTVAEQEDFAGDLDLVRKLEEDLEQRDDKVFAEAAKKLVKLNKNYTLEMSSF